ncbi:acyl--CoA ligase [Curvibacter sp. CHRR-16]|uniref:class I adenylate-forming enzyme family protein n=1 Tax=Curvibacter sp. CHRR-16 TaxID=2835872 RepID=UPI001BDAF0B4|nr:class I adenylate-forming enzyme family protein [Curvibacter sp. CHRR-16]MBT0570396.1 acyl--CoA ligase [Curvibacter sp. CHRR-16]
MLMHSLLLNAAERQPEHAAFTWVDRKKTLNYGQAAQAMEHMAGALHSLGVRKGDRVTIVAHNGMDYLIAMLGAWRIGAISALVNVKFAEQLDYYFSDHTPKVVIYTHDLAHEVHTAAAQASCISHLICMDGPGANALSLPELLQAQLPAPPDPADEQAIAHLSYTSGTTGKPKGACLMHEPTVRASRCIGERLRLRSSDVSFGPTALSSSYQLVANLLPPLSVGASVHVMRFWTAESGWEALDLANASHLVGNPTILQDILEASAIRGCPPRNLRLGLSGGGPVPVALKRAWRDTLKLPLVESFGQSELGGFMALGYPELEPNDSKLQRVGPPLPDKEVRITSPQGTPLAPNQVGQITLTGGFMWGYWGKEEATAKALHSGSLHTGDLGLMDEEGFITMRGRESEQFVVNEQTWFSRDIEEGLCLQDGVRQAALVNAATTASERCMPMAYITLKPGFSKETFDLEQTKLRLQTLLSRDIGFLQISVMDEFPMTPTGKIAKSTLSELARLC